MSTRQIFDRIKDIYGFEVSEGLVTGITNKLLPEIEAWQKRPLSALYPIVFIDTIVFNVKEDNVIRKLAAYVILGVSEEGHKEVLSITIGESESAKFWLSVLNELKNRGLKPCLRLSTWPHSNSPENGRSPCGTGVRSMLKFRSCTRIG